MDLPDLVAVDLPDLDEALGIGTQELIPDEDLQIHHEDVVETLEPTVLPVELDVGSEDIVDLHSSVMFLSGDVVAVENHYAAASDDFLAVLDDIPVEGNVQNQSTYEEGQSSSPEAETDQGLDSLPALVSVEEIEQVHVQELELDPVPVDEIDQVFVQELELVPVPALVQDSVGPLLDETKCHLVSFSLLINQTKSHLV